jgi:hypothetical protein
MHLDGDLFRYGDGAEQIADAVDEVRSTDELPVAVIAITERSVLQLALTPVTQGGASRLRRWADLWDPFGANPPDETKGALTRIALLKLFRGGHTGSGCKLIAKGVFVSKRMSIDQADQPVQLQQCVLQPSRS